MKSYAMRLGPGRDLRLELEAFAAAHDLRATFVMTCVGSLSVAALRMAGRSETVTIEAPFEIVSLVGTVSPDGAHIHISLSDETGAMIGGHLREGSVVRTTAEVILGELTDVEFARRVCPESMYAELEVRPRG